HLWSFRTLLSNRKLYGQPILDSGLRWYEYGEVNPGKQRIPLSIAFAEIATHNHFVLDRGSKVFKQTAPVIKMHVTSSEEDHLCIAGLLNSSAACFWMKQMMMNKGGGGIGGGLKSEYWDRGFVFNSTKLERFPLPEQRPLALAVAIDIEAQRLDKI